MGTNSIVNEVNEENASAQLKTHTHTHMHADTLLTQQASAASFLRETFSIRVIIVHVLEGIGSHRCLLTHVHTLTLLK